MIDATSTVRLLDELVWTLRRRGLPVAPSQAIDLVGAVRALGWDDRTAVREAIAAVVVQRASDRSLLDGAFDEFFHHERGPSDLWGRLAALGFERTEIESLRALLALASASDGEGAGGANLDALLHGGAEIGRLLNLAGFRRQLQELRSPLQLGFFTQRAMDTIGLRGARSRLQWLRQHLRGALGARGDTLADALARELDRAGDEVRDHLRRSLTPVARDRRSGARPRSADAPFTSLTDAEIEEVVRAVRGFADRLRGGERVRRRRSRRGRIDPARTLRSLLRTGGLPFSPERRRRHRDKPRLVLLCDVSESVRTASRFMLEFVHAAHDLFDRTRSFVFVSELAETTRLFEENPPRVALAAAYGGDVVPVTDNSNYGRVFRAFEHAHIAAVDRRTTIVILGDGRTNYHEAAERSLARIAARARGVYWMSNELRASWASGDSAMSRYAPHCTAVLEVTTSRELEEATRTLLRSR